MLSVTSSATTATTNRIAGTACARGERSATISNAALENANSGTHPRASGSAIADGVDRTPIAIRNTAAGRARNVADVRSRFASQRAPTAAKINASVSAGQADA